LIDDFILTNKQINKLSFEVIFNLFSFKIFSKFFFIKIYKKLNKKFSTGMVNSYIKRLKFLIKKFRYGILEKIIKHIIRYEKIKKLKENTGIYVHFVFNCNISLDFYFSNFFLNKKKIEYAFNLF